MTKAEHLSDFIEEHFNHILVEKLEEQKNYFIENKTSLLVEFQNKFLESEARFNCDEPVYIAYKFLNTSLTLNKRGEYLIENLNASPAESLRDFANMYDSTWALKGFFELDEELEKIRKTYVGAISRLDLQVILHRNLHKFLYYVELLARLSLADIQLQNASCVLIGDYFSDSDISFNSFHAYRNPVLSGYTLEDWLNKTQNDQACCDFRDLNFSGGEYAAYNFSFAKLESCVAANIVFKASDFTRSRIISSDISHSDFSSVSIIGANFYGSNLEGTSFDVANAYDNEGARFLGHAIFEEANLKDASFSNADLRYANFINARFENTNFKDADLTNAAFKSKDISKLDFTEAQKRSIKLVE